MKRETMVLGELPLQLELESWAQQAQGSVVLKVGDAVVLVTVCGDQGGKKLGFFPLTVEYRYRFAGAGRIPGAYGKREGRASAEEILSSRFIDRSIRPLFPKQFQAETQVIATVFSGDPEVDIATATINAVSLALSLSEIPWDGPVVGVRVARIDGELRAFPPLSQIANADLDFVVTVGEEGVLMVEGEADEVSEEDLVSCLAFAKEIAQQGLIQQRRLRKKSKITKRTLEDAAVIPAELQAIIDGQAHLLETALLTPVKKERAKALKLALGEIRATATQQLPEIDPEILGSAISQTQKSIARSLILNGQRFDGRATDEVRPLSHEVAVLPSAHGSAVFTRGETQALASTTLGGPRDSLREDGLYEMKDTGFFLHYNFPPYSVGETRPIRGPGRREVGHGHLAQRALAKVMPEFGDFPYTVRVTSDILSSNGSSSMATVCAGCLALMDAGVPIRATVAGVAMGLIKEGEKAVVLTDILGDEDHLGDMDFKVCGTKEGVTALQMDLKIDGLSDELLRSALEQARHARLQILKSMKRTLEKARTEVSGKASKVVVIKVPNERIGDVIGPGGKNIRHLSATTGAQLDLDDDGKLRISSQDRRAVDAAQKAMVTMLRQPVLGEVLPATVMKIGRPFTRVELFPGVEASMHVSEVAENLHGPIESVLELGGTCMVRVMGVDDYGKIVVSHRQA